MLRSLKELIDYKIIGIDGHIGVASDYYFDDLHWVIRYLVVDFDLRIPNQNVLLSPYVIKEPDWTSKEIGIRLTKAQMEKSPSIEADKPISRQHETDLSDYFKWPIYWAVNGIAGEAIADKLVDTTSDSQETSDEENHDSHLRSVNEVLGYQVEANDGAVGQVADIIIDIPKWTVNYLVVSTGSWLSDKNVLMAPSWISQLAWATSKVFVDLTKDSIENGPEYNPNSPINSDNEQQLYDFHGRPYPT